MSDTLKILLLGDYSNCQRSLAVGLRRMGCDVTLISDGSTWQDCDRDIDIKRPPGRLGGLRLLYKLSHTLRQHLSGYDIVSIHDPNFARLRPVFLKPLFKRLRKTNGSVFLNAMSNDLPFLDMLAAKDCPLAYSEWFVNGEKSRLFNANPQRWNAWQSDGLRRYQDYIYQNINGAVAVLYEYYLALERALPASRICYGGIPIVTDNFEPVEIPENLDCVNLFLGRDRTRLMIKGTDILEEAARIVMNRYPGRAKLTLVENVPFNEFVRLLRDSHIVLDQIYSYTPATTALMAMAYGIPTVSGGETDYYDFIGEEHNRPIINAPISLDELVEVLDFHVNHPEQLAQRGKDSRRFVEQHNACEKVAQRYLDFWLSRKQC